MLVRFSFKFKLKINALKINTKQMKFQGGTVKLNENMGMLIFILNEINIKISCFPY